MTRSHARGGRFRVGVLASGHGSNLQSLLDRVHGEQGIEIAAVAGDRPGARALQRARAAGIPERVFELADYGDREARDAAVAEWLQDHGVELVVLAGYMQLVTPDFLARFPQRVINVHPALLPAFPGLHAIEQALAHAVKVFGVTVHFVDEGIDSGPIIFQRSFELPDARTPEEVLEHVRPAEFDLLADAVRLIAAGRIRRDPQHPRRVVVE